MIPPGSLRHDTLCHTPRNDGGRKALTIYPLRRHRLEASWYELSGVASQYQGSDLFTLQPCTLHAPLVLTSLDLSSQSIINRLLTRSQIPCFSNVLSQACEINLIHHALKHRMDYCPYRAAEGGAASIRARTCPFWHSWEPTISYTTYQAEVVFHLK